MWKTPLSNLAKVDGDTADTLTRLYLFNFTERIFRSRAFYDSHIRLSIEGFRMLMYLKSEQGKRFLSNHSTV